MNKNQLKKVINNLQTYVDDKIDNLPVSYEEKLLMTVPKESIDKSKADAATNDSPYTINIPIVNGFEYVDSMFDNADVMIEYNGKKYMSVIFAKDTINIIIESENNIFAFNITKDNSSDIQLVIRKLNTTNITDIKLYMRKKDININDLKVNNSISIGRIGTIGVNSSAIGNGVKASGNFSHAEGDSTTSSGNSSHAEGYNTTSSGNSSHAEGYNTTASKNYSHAEGYKTTASGNGSHAEGDSTTSSGDISHAEGYKTTASGMCTHSEGDTTTASGDCSHAEGYYTKASSENQHVQGKYNIEDNENKYAHIVGNGTYETARSNAHTLDWQGNAWYAGKLSQEGTPTEDKDLTTKKYVDDKIKDTLVTTNISDTTLALTTDKYQTATIVDGTEITLPAVTSFTEIHLFFSTTTDLTLTLPACKWQNGNIPTISANKTYEFIFTYTTEWLGGVIQYE